MNHKKWYYLKSGRNSPKVALPFSNHILSKAQRKWENLQKYLRRFGKIRVPDLAYLPVDHFLKVLDTCHIDTSYIQLRFSSQKDSLPPSYNIQQKYFRE